MTAFTSLLVAVAAVALPMAAGNPIIEERALNCKKPAVKAFASIVKKAAGPVVTPFCSSYLYYDRTRTVTETITDYNYKYKYVTSGTLTLAEFTTDYIPIASLTITKVVPTYTGAALPKRKREAAAAAAPAPAPPKPPVPAAIKLPKPDTNGALFGFKASAVSDACSCLVTGTPGPTETSYTFKTKKTTETIYIPTTTVTQLVSCHEFSYLLKRGAYMLGV